jgi:hypothetical protein
MSGRDCDSEIVIMDVCGYSVTQFTANKAGDFDHYGLPDNNS